MSGTGGSKWAPASGATTSFTDTSGSNTHTLTYNGGYTLNNPQALTINYVDAGVSGTSASTTITVDAGSSFTVIAILTGTYTANTGEYIYQMPVNGLQIITNSSVSSGPSQQNTVVTLTIANGATVTAYSGNDFYVQTMAAASNSLPISTSGQYYTAAYTKTAAWEVDLLPEPTGGGGGGGGGAPPIQTISTSATTSATNTTVTTSATMTPVTLKSGLAQVAAAVLIIALVVIGGIAYDTHDKRKYVH